MDWLKLKSLEVPQNPAGNAPVVQRARGAVLKATEQPIDTGTAAGRCFLDMLGVFASSRPTSAESGSWRVSPRQRQPASTKGGRRR
jgi:hypothetical protein